MVLSHVADSRGADKGKEGSKRGNLYMSHASQPAVPIKNGHFYGKAGKEQQNYLSEKKNPTQTKRSIWTSSLIKDDLTANSTGRGVLGRHLGLSDAGKDVSGSHTCTKTIWKQQQEVLPTAQKNLTRKQESRRYEV